MKEFIEKLIGRLGEQQAEAENEMHRLRSGDYTLPCSYDITDIKEIASESFKESIEIVNQLAEEYKIFGNSEQVKGGWIPCSERLPEVNGWYLVTNELGVVQQQHWGASHWEKLRDDAVIAWMPLPAPYTEGE